MDTAEIAYAIRRIVNGELDDCERAIKAGDMTKAIRELDDAVSKLKRLANRL